MQNLGIPLLLMAAVWSAFSVVLKVIEILNKKRDLIINISKDGERLTTYQKSIIFKNDYNPMKFGMLAFLSILTIIIAFLPTILKGDGIGITETLLCYIVSAFVGINTIFIFCTLNKDTEEIKKSLNIFSSKESIS